MEPGVHGLTLNILTQHTYLDAHSIHDEPALITLESTELGSHNKIFQMSLVVLIDTSGSMYGDKLDAVRASLMYLLNNIEPDCEITLIQFASVVDLLTPIPIQSDSHGIIEIKNIIAQLHARGNTNMTDAIDQAIKCACMRKTHFDDVHILIFSDGRHNIGRPWNTLFSKIKHVPMPIHTFSIGSGPDASILMQLSNKSSGGIYQHMQSSDDVPRVFGAKVGYLSSKLYTNCRLEIEAHAGVRIINIDGKDPGDQEITPFKKYNLNIGTILASRKKIFLLRLSIRALNDAEINEFGGAHQLLRTRLTAGSHTIISVSSVSRTDPSTLQIGPSEQRRLDEARMYAKTKSTIAEAITLAEQGNLHTAKKYIHRTITHIQINISNDDAAVKYIEELKRVYGLLLDSDTYQWGRSNIYSIADSYEKQSGGIYTTLYESASSENLMNCLRNGYTNYY
jgi:Mg-chelatase subunit ChlD